MIDPVQCQHLQSEPRRRTKSNGIVVVTVQCLTCGRSLGEKSKAGFTITNLPPYDEQLLGRNYSALRPLVQAQHEAASAEWWTRYNEYLTSDHWRRVRRIVLERDRDCQVCFHALAEQAHHLTYDSFKKWGYSFSVECVGICRSCHESLHHDPA